MEVKNIINGIASMGLGAMLALSADAALSYKPLQGFSYGPFRDGQNPNLGIYPSELQMSNDLTIIKNIAPKIRTYGDENTLYQIPKLCNNAGIDCYPGAWLSTDTNANETQINSLISIASSNFPTTKGLIVGNEVLLRGDMPKSSLINYINRVKTKTGKKVSTADSWYYFSDVNNSDLVNAVDFIVIHSHPYWEGISIGGAAQQVVIEYNLVAQKNPSKEIIVGETGWPSAGPSYGSAVPGIENQKKFLSDFDALSRQNNINYFFFEPFDEKWKGEGGVGAYWGIFNSDRTKKSSLTNLLQQSFKINSINRKTNNMQLNVNTFDGNPYSIYSSTNLTSWQFMTNFSGAVLTNRTSITLSNQNSSKKFFRATQNF